MPIQRISEFPPGSGSLSNDDIFLFMDNPSGSGVTKKISLSELTDAIGVIAVSGATVDIGDISFSGSTISTTTSNQDITIATNGSGDIYIEADNNNWVFNQTGHINLPTSGNISLSNGTTLALGTFDNGTGGQNGISLNCYVGYELNWQGGHLKSSPDGGITTSNIWCDSPIEFQGSGVDNMQIDSGGITYPDGTTQSSLYSGLSSVLSLGAISGTNAINYGSDRLIQTLTLNGSATTFTKGSGWPSSSTVSADTVLKITTSSATSITWSIVTDWFNQPAAGALTTGTHLFLLRAVGSGVIEGHYIGNKTN